MEGGNEAQSQGEGVAEFRALQEQQRVLRKTYDDLRGAVMGTANAAARGRARAEAKLSDVLESSRRVRAAYMKGSPMFESLSAEREKLKAELLRVTKVADKHKEARNASDDELRKLHQKFRLELKDSQDELARLKKENLSGKDHLSALQDAEGEVEVKMDERNSLLKSVAHELVSQIRLCAPNKQKLPRRARMS